MEAGIQQLETRLAALEQALRAPSKPSEGDFWALEHLRQAARPGGEVVFAGYVELASDTWGWQWGLPVGELLSTPWAEAAETLVALGHPLRLEILRAVLYGESKVQDLQHLAKIGTTSQLYHHLKELQVAGWLKVGKRGTYNDFTWTDGFKGHPKLPHPATPQVQSSVFLSLFVNGEVGVSPPSPSGRRQGVHVNLVLCGVRRAHHSLAGHPGRLWGRNPRNAKGKIRR